MTDTISENNFWFSVYYCYLVTEKINTLQEMYFSICHIDIILYEELWENRMSLQGNKETSIKEFFHIKIFEPNYSFSEYKTLIVGRKEKNSKEDRQKTKNKELFYRDALHM